MWRSGRRRKAVVTRCWPCCLKGLAAPLWAWPPEEQSARVTCGFRHSRGFLGPPMPTLQPGTLGLGLPLPEEPGAWALPRAHQKPPLLRDSPPEPAPPSQGHAGVAGFLRSKTLTPRPREAKHFPAARRRSRLQAGNAGGSEPGLRTAPATPARTRSLCGDTRSNGALLSPETHVPMRQVPLFVSTQRSFRPVTAWNQLRACPGRPSRVAPARSLARGRPDAPAGLPWVLRGGCDGGRGPALGHLHLPEGRPASPTVCRGSE